MKDLHDTETRITNEATGGQKGKKLCQIGALDPVALIEVGRVAGMGANKYAAHNFLKGYDWSLSFNAMMRHAMLFWAGEDVDPESGLSHMAHVAWQAMALVSFVERAVGNDDRPPSATSDVAQEGGAGDALRDMVKQIISEEHGEVWDKDGKNYRVDTLANNIEERMLAILARVNDPVA